MSNTKLTADQQRIRELEAELKVAKSEITERDEVILELDAQMQVSIEEAKNTFLIAELDGQKYELRFGRLRMPIKKGMWKEVSAQEVKENSALLEKLVQKGCALIVPYFPKNTIDNTADAQFSKPKGGKV